MSRSVQFQTSLMPEIEEVEILNDDHDPIGVIYRRRDSSLGGVIYKEEIARFIFQCPLE